MSACKTGCGSAAQHHEHLCESCGVAWVASKEFTRGEMSHAMGGFMRAFREEQQRDDEKRLVRAVADVMDEGHAVYAAAKNRRVSGDALRAALENAGWTPPHLDGKERRTFGEGKRKV